ncbi:hypothetical protein [Arenimonas daejeonensis]|uniref:hypothetical protein n=1 Tax=Arenimonas daejeonensis TaxID=370777 RepID=UPI0011BE3BB7|nr:hypothetical protein [Arenimonas daejeonensis]
MVGFGAAAGGQRHQDLAGADGLHQAHLAVHRVHVDHQHRRLGFRRQQPVVAHPGVGLFEMCHDLGFFLTGEAGETDALFGHYLYSP